MAEEETPVHKKGTQGRRGRGQSMVEFALTAPLLVLMFLGLIEIGNALNSYLTVLASARDAARLAAQGGATPTTMLSMIDNETDRLPTDVPTGSLNCSSGAGVDIRGLDGSCQALLTVSGKAAVQVKVCYDHPLFVRIPGIAEDTLRLCSKTTMRRIS